MCSVQWSIRIAQDSSECDLTFEISISTNICIFCTSHFNSSMGRSQMKQHALWHRLHCARHRIPNWKSSNSSVEIIAFCSTLFSISVNERCCTFITSTKRMQHLCVNSHKSQRPSSHKSQRPSGFFYPAKKYNQ